MATSTGRVAWNAYPSQYSRPSWASAWAVRKALFSGWLNLESGQERAHSGQLRAVSTAVKLSGILEEPDMEVLGESIPPSRDQVEVVPLLASDNGLNGQEMCNVELSSNQGQEIHHCIPRRVFPVCWRQRACAMPRAKGEEILDRGIPDTSRGGRLGFPNRALRGIGRPLAGVPVHTSGTIGPYGLPPTRVSQPCIV